MLKTQGISKSHSEVKAVNEVSLPKLKVPFKIKGRTCRIKLDTATGGNFISRQTWKDMGSPELEKPDLQYESASTQSLSIIGTYKTKADINTYLREALPIFSSIFIKNNKLCIPRGRKRTLHLTFIQRH